MESFAGTYTPLRPLPAGATAIGEAANYFRRRASRLLIALASIVLLALIVRSVSPASDGCEGGCFQKKPVTRSKGDGNRPKNSYDSELMKQAARVDPFSTSDEDLDKLTDEDLDLDDEEKEKEEEDDRLVKVEDDDTGDDGQPKTVVKMAIPHEDGGTDEDDDDEGSGEYKFKPMVEGTIGYEMMRYKDSLDELPETKMKIDADATLESRGISVDSGIHVITTFFRGTYHDRRFKELLATIVSNMENPQVTALHVLWQAADPRFLIPDSIAQQLVDRNLHLKLVLTEVKKQPTYKTMFSYANSVLQRGAVAIITNADIYFDHTLRCVSLPPKNYTTLYNHPEKIKNRVSLALSRRHSPICKGKPDHKSYFDLCERYTLSHDAFVFAPPVPKSIIARTDHTQNQGYGAENIVIFEFKRENYRVLNPCYMIKGYHLHCSPERHYVANFINRSPPRPGVSVPIKRKCDIWVY